MPASTTPLAARIADTARLKAALAAVAKAQRDAAATQAAAEAALTAAAKVIDDRRADAEKARRALAAIPTPADATPQLAALAAALVALREAEAAQVAAQEAGGLARAAPPRLAAQAAAVGAALDVAAAAEAAERKATDRREALKTAANAPSATALKAAATTGLGAPLAAAKAKVEADIPADAAAPEKSLLDRIRARRQRGDDALALADAIAADTLDAESAWQEATTRDAAKLPRLRRALDASVAKLAAFLNAAPQVRDAEAALAALAAQPGSPLTAEQRDALFDATLESDRQDALARLTLADEAATTLDAKRRSYAAALAAARATTPDATEDELAANDPPKAKRKDVADAKKAFDDAVDDITADDRKLLAAWFIAIPDALWTRLDALDDAVATLEAVAAASPAALTADIAAKEAALAAAMDGAAAEARAAIAIAAQSAAATDAAMAAKEVAPRRRRALSHFVAEA
ncbi:hypothetical protein [Falsiroseomonas sp. HW251]|uniref:hypothetical protein n=1 Tax=Falsiroseomonas sp. HW251 TaxID=3390998 RepID=UPI003D316B1B